MSALGFQKPAVKGNYTSRWSISAANHPETSSTLFDWVQHHNHKYSCFMAMLEFLTRSKHGLSQGSQAGWFSPIMGRADSPSTWQMRNIKSWLLADSEGCASSALSSPLGWFCWVMLGQLCLPQPRWTDHCCPPRDSKATLGTRSQAVQGKTAFSLLNSIVDGQGLSVLHQGQSQIHPVLCIQQQPVLQAKIKIRKTHLLLFFLKTCRAHEENL